MRVVERPLGSDRSEPSYAPSMFISKSQYMEFSIVFRAIEKVTVNTVNVDVGAYAHFATD